MIKKAIQELENKIEDPKGDSWCLIPQHGGGGRQTQDWGPGSALEADGLFPPHHLQPQCGICHLPRPGLALPRGPKPRMGGGCWWENPCLSFP